ncbi:IclR family transcriptional regulator [Actinomadura macra]|uniref:IclR family transcriptional regulator n=1 Tax=Actinomadura macra TaxID=46164 RepID=UPI00082ADBB3|nr:helix-turn-helix domain-containing protein [Actinomadura macra]
MAAAENGNPGKSVIHRAFAVLMSFDVAHRYLTLSQLSRRSGLPVATTFRLLNHLEVIDVVERDTAGRYSIGPRVWELGILAPTHDVTGKGTRPLLVRLAARTGMMVRVFAYKSHSALCLEEVLANGASSSGGGPGLALPLADSAAGRVLLVRMAPAARKSLPLTRVQFDQVEEGIAAYGRQGWVRFVRSDGQAEYAVAIDAEGRPPMALSVSQPPTRAAGAKADPLPAAAVKSLVSELQSVAHALATALARPVDPPGHASPPPYDSEENTVDHEQ